LLYYTYQVVPIHTMINLVLKNQDNFSDLRNQDIFVLLFFPKLLEQEDVLRMMDTIYSTIYHGFAYD